MSNIYYGGKPINEVDFNKELEKELKILEQNISKIKAKKDSGKINSQYWTIKLNRANKVLEEAKVTLD